MTTARKVSAQDIVNGFGGGVGTRNRAKAVLEAARSETTLQLVREIELLHETHPDGIPGGLLEAWIRSTREVAQRDEE